MSRNSSTINSDQSHRSYTIGLVIIIVLPLAISYAAFLARPSLFYFRAWEYLSEVFPSNPYQPQEWIGYEKGDLSRSFIFRFQDEHRTHVLLDTDGFRVLPLTSDNYTILVYGDSQGFGSGLSNDETFTWQLATKVGLPIFDGTRTDIPNRLLSKPNLKTVKVIIHVVQSMAVRIKSYFPKEFRVLPYVPIRMAGSSVPIQRYYFPFAIFRMFSVMAKDLFYREYINGYMCSAGYTTVFSDGEVYSHPVSANVMYADSMPEQIEMISNFSRQLSHLGLTYVLVLVPKRELLYSDNVDDYTVGYFPRLIRDLEEKGVLAVDLQPSFLEHKDLGLFFKTDTHWNARGVELASDIVSDYLRHHALIATVSAVSK